MIFDPVGAVSANQNLTSTENSGANTPVRKISAHEFEASGGGYLRPMVSTTCDGTPTFLPIQDSEKMENGLESKGNVGYSCKANSIQLNVQTSSASLQHSQSAMILTNIVSNHGTAQFKQTAQLGATRFRPTIMTMKSREELESIKDEKELIFELVKDICNDLDVKSLCHKILKNVSILTNADRCSLFLVSLFFHKNTIQMN